MSLSVSVILRTPLAESSESSESETEFSVFPMWNDFASDSGSFGPPESVGAPGSRSPLTFDCWRVYRSLIRTQSLAYLWYFVR